jgi:uncharacterized protein (DUF2062 family)
MITALRRRLESLAAVDGAPHRTALSLAIGVGLSFSPLLGFQILIAVAVAFIFRLSKVAMLLGLCANVPWVMLPWYAITTAGAATVLGTSSTGDLGDRLRAMISVPFYRSTFWGHAGELLDVFLWPFLLGPSIGAICLGVVKYIQAIRVLTPQSQAPDASTSLSSGDAEKRAADRHVEPAQGASFEAEKSAQ